MSSYAEFAHNAQTTSFMRRYRPTAFYLLKKYTSYTFLEFTTGFYRDFVNAFEKQLDEPDATDEFYERTFVRCLLPHLAMLDEGLALLKSGNSKRSAYEKIKQGRNYFHFLYGRAADFWAVPSDPVFIRLGAADRPRDGGPLKDTSYFKDAVSGIDCIDALLCTANLDYDGSLRYEREGRTWYKHWTFESLFQCSERHDETFPPYRDTVIGNLLYPDHNHSTKDEIKTGRTIPFDGIWEPWFVTGRVGCPNYFLAGQTAHAYLLEGTCDEVPVRWRPIWKDERYRDGTIPQEEDDYLEKAAPPKSWRALPGDKCPRTGHWFSVAMGTVHVREGEPMPGPEVNDRGWVIWSMPAEIPQPKPIVDHTWLMPREMPTDLQHLLSSASPPLEVPASPAGEADPGPPPPDSPAPCVATTGQPCPRTGWWQCEPESLPIEGGRRRFIAAGETVPHVTLLGEPRLWDRLLLRRPVFRVVTSWVLVEAADGAAVP